MAKKMSMKQYEKSSADAKADKAHAKKAGMSEKKWEGSPGDMRADKKGLAKMNKKRK